MNNPYFNYQMLVTTLNFLLAMMIAATVENKDTLGNLSRQIKNSYSANYTIKLIFMSQNHAMHL